MRHIATMILALLLASVNAGAQPPGSRFQTTASCVAGTGTTWDDEGRIGSGPLVGVRADRRVLRNTFLEVSLDYLQHERSGRFTAEGHTVLVTGSVIQRFGRGRAQPYALGGITATHHEGTSGFPENDIAFSTENTSFGYVFGGGVAVRIGHRFEAGPEARFLTLAGDDGADPAWASWVGGRFGMRF